MVVLIFEGPDNLGKSTIINKIVSNFKDTRDILMMHATGPRSAQGEDPFEYQSTKFETDVNFIREFTNFERHFDPKYVTKKLGILDRAWFGEYVYGQIYRNGNPDHIIAMIDTCESNMGEIPHVIINLQASPEFIIAHDDNKSITSAMDSAKRLESVKRELALFNECFDKAKYYRPTNVLNINVEGKNLEYKNIDTIYEEIIKGIASFNIEL